MVHKVKFIAIICVSSLLASCGGTNSSSSNSSSSSSSSNTPSSTSSTSSETKREVVKKTLDVYKKGKVSYNVDTYFLDDIDAPYLKFSDVLTKRMTTNLGLGFPIPNYSVNYLDGVLTANQTYNNATYSITIDSKLDTIYSDHYLDTVDIFHEPLPFDLVAADPSPIIKPVAVTRNSPTVHTVFDLKKYNIDLYAYEGTILVPLVVLNPIFFFIGEKNFTYSGKALYLSSELGILGSSSSAFGGTFTEAEKDVERNKDTTEFTTNSLFWTLDTFYGRFTEAGFTSFEELSKYIGVYDKLTSSKPSTFFAGVAELITKIDDLHSGITESAPSAGSRWGNDSKDDVVKDSIFKSNDLWRGYRTINYGNEISNLYLKRATAKVSDPGSFSYSGDTCFIRFDTFARLDNSSVFLANHVVKDNAGSVNTYNLFYNAFKDLKANHSGVKNIVIDESMNGGGQVNTLIEIAGFLMSTVTITLQNSITKEVFDYSYKVDTNYDGVYNDDDYQAKGYKVYCEISPASFSCGNLLPSVLKEGKAATIIGQTSGGGCCAVGYYSSSLGDTFTLSSPICLGLKTSDGGFVSIDRGISPTIYLNDDYMYDETSIIEKIDA